MQRFTLFALSLVVAAGALAAEPDYTAESPGPEHEKLAPLVGEFRTEAKAWFESKDEAATSEGRAVHRWVLGKRFIEMKTESRGTTHGRMEGIGFVGFDVNAKKYVANWMDSLVTTIARGEGTLEGDVLTIRFESRDPHTDKMIRARSLWRIGDPKRLVFEMFEPGDRGERKVLEVIYTREK